MEQTTLLDPGRLADAIGAHDLAEARRLLTGSDPGETAAVLNRLRANERGVAFRLLPKDRALAVFEQLDAANAAELVRLLRSDETAAVFTELDPADRVDLLDELPAGIAARLLAGLPATERELTSVVLGYPKGSTGREMSPEVARVRADANVAEALRLVLGDLVDSETIYTIAVVDSTRLLVGVVSLRDLLAAEPTLTVGDLARPADTAAATEPAEQAARRCAERRRLALPVVDSEQRLVGVLTVDEALRILEAAESEDQARLGGVEPLRRHYLSTPIRNIVRSRVVWLLVLAVGATLTVNVLELFEATLAEMVVLSVFIPLLIGTGGNTGNQAATTVTRALALGEIRPSDALAVLGRELVTGAMLGLVLGGLGFTFASLLYGIPIGTVIGLTLLSICSLAATMGGAMPLLAKLVRADPAVFSNPFISTFVDATGLLVYFGIAKLVLGL